MVEEFSQARKLIGCGNGMQFFGAILIKSDLSLEEIDSHYSAYRDVEWEYIVYSWGDGMSPFRNFDLRGN